MKLLLKKSMDECMRLSEEVIHLEAQVSASSWIGVDHHFYPFIL